MFNHKTLIYILFVLSCLAINLLAVATWDTSYVMNDGVQYLSTAENLLNGNGLTTNALMYTPHFQGYLPAPQTVWPPGYPAVIATGGLAGQNLTYTALILNLFFHLLASILVALILMRMNVETVFALICAALFYAMAVPWSAVRGIMTEPLFISLILVSILLLPVPGHSKNTTWLFCGILIAASVCVRFSAVFYAASVGTGIFCYLVVYNRGIRQFTTNFYRLISLVSIPVAALLAIMYRTHSLTGTLARNTGSRQPESLSTAISHWAAQTSDLLGMSGGAVFSFETGLILFFGLILIVTGIFATALFVHRKTMLVISQATHTNYARLAGFVLLIHCVFLFLFLTYTTLTESPAHIIGRYIYQIYPGIYIVFCAVTFSLVQTLRNPKTDRIPKILTAAIATLSAIYMIAQFNELAAPQRFFAEGKTTRKVLATAVSQNLSLSEFIRNCYAATVAGASIWSTHGQQLHYQTGIPTLTLTENYTHLPVDLQRLQEQIESYNIRLFIFNDNPLNSNSQYMATMLTIKQWLVQNGHSPIAFADNKVDSSTTVEAYAVDGQCSTVR